MSIFVPWLPNAIAMAPVPGLVLLDWFYWRGLNRSQKLALLAHEWKHHDQQKHDGWFTFMQRYFFDKEWREFYEKQADLAQKIVYKKLTNG